MKLLFGNGNLLVYLDEFSQIKDFYFPFVGQENHIGKQPHKVGIWVDGKMNWLDKSWEIETHYKKDSLVGKIIARKIEIGVEVEFNDAVHYRDNIYIRKITVRNLGEARQLKLFLCQYFSIYGTDIGNTAYYFPLRNAIVYYKNNRYFLVSGSKPFNDFAIGKFNFNGLKGTYMDAEDGELSKSAIDHGSVDSAISFHFMLESSSEASVCYWIAAGKKLKDVMVLNENIRSRPEKIIKETDDYWKRWVSKIKLDVEDDILDLVKRSLLIIRAHVDNRGGILASTDSDILKLNRDSYNYIWPRDSAFAAMLLDEAGYSDLSRLFFLFCSKSVEGDGYFLPKYNPNYSPGSSWHPWIKYDKMRLPIQEDETALVLHALWKHYEKTRDEHFIRSIYKNFIRKSADFMVDFRKSEMPGESYDLWEEKFGSHTFTACTVYAALVAAANFAKLLKRAHEHKRYIDAANEVKKSITTDLYDRQNKQFFRRIKKRGEEMHRESIVDSSTGYALHEFVLNPNDEKVVNEMKLIKERLLCRTDIGGVARYEGDNYFRVSEATPGNPWFICTLWLAQYQIKIAKSVADLEEVRKTLKWVVRYASTNGFLSEQLNPLTGEQVSVTPLVWSHSTFADTVFRYAKKMKQLS